MQAVKQLALYDLQERAYTYLNLYTFGAVLTFLIVAIWIAIWAVIAFVFTSASQHISAQGGFTVAAIIAGVLLQMIFHAAMIGSRRISRVKGRLIIMGFHAIRWPYFVLLLLSDDPLAWSFAFAFELVICPAVGLLFCLALCISVIFIKSKEELKTIT